MSGNPASTPPAGAVTMAAGQGYLEIIEAQLEATETLFRQRLNSDVPFIREAGDYIFRGGGKRVRPALLLLAARMLEHDGEEEVAYAAAVELIHTATLVHDDVIDRSELRRGRASVHHLWGNSRTVLLGDWLYTTAMQEALSFGNVEVIRRLCAATAAMIEGELLALERLGDLELGESEYFAIIERKTARLFGAAASLPSLIEPPQPEAGAALERFGQNLGICFQLVDDLLDYTARPDELGKPVLSDLREGKLTLPLLLALPHLGSEERELVRRVLERRAVGDGEPERILRLVEREGTLEETRRRAARYARQAREALAFFPDGDARQALELAPEFVLRRRS